MSNFRIFAFSVSAPVRSRGKFHKPPIFQYSQCTLYCNVMYTQCTLCPISEFSRFLSLLPLAREESSTNPEYSNIPRLDLKGYPISAERRRTNGGGCSAFLGGARPSGCARDAPSGGDCRRRAGRQPERHLAPDGRARPPAGCLK